MRLTLKLAAVLAALLMAACSSTPTDQQKPAEVVDGQATPTSQTTAPTTGADSPANPGQAIDLTARTTNGPGGELTDPKSTLSKRSVYFNFDEYSVREEFRPLIQAHASFLAKNRDARMLIQGNTDERGSREYNIALGQRRAEAMKRMMVLLGAQEAQIDAVSLGKEKPRREGHTEADWAENRRGEILYNSGALKEF